MTKRINSHSRFITIQNIKTHYMVKGQGEPLIFLHGWPGKFEGFKKLVENLSTDNFGQIPINKLFNKYKIIGLDWPGFGKSQELKKDYTLDNLADFLDQFLKEIKINNAVVIAVSMGGYIALRAQQKYPNLFKKMIIFGVAGDMNHLKLFRLGGFAVKLMGRKISTASIGFIKNNSFLTNQIQKKILPVSFQKAKETQKYIKNVKKISSRVHYEVIREFLTKNFTSATKGIKIPVIFVGAKLDPIFPPEKIKEFADQIKNSKVILVEGDDHSPSANINKRINTYKKILGEILGLP